VLVHKTTPKLRDTAPATQDAVDIGRRQPELVDPVDPVGYETTRGDKETGAVDRRRRCRAASAAVIRDPFVPAGSAGFAAIQTVAPSFGVELTPVGVRDADEIERGIAAFAHGSNDGLIMVGPPSLAWVHRDLIITLAARHRLPAVYSSTFFVTYGGLIAYGVHVLDQYRRAAGYVDRILRGEKPADLPVQAPTRYELVVNLKAAKALGLEVPPMLLARADEAIE
jgi:putative ABC transport system substrate-binding protein